MENLSHRKCLSLEKGNVLHAAVTHIADLFPSILKKDRKSADRSWKGLFTAYDRHEIWSRCFRTYTTSGTRTDADLCEETGR